MHDFSLMNIGKEIWERQGDFHQIVSLLLNNDYYDALEERNENH
jgi:integrase/recombinase XerD